MLVVMVLVVLAVQRGRDFEDAPADGALRNSFAE